MRLQDYLELRTEFAQPRPTPADAIWIDAMRAVTIVVTPPQGHKLVLVFFRTTWQTSW